MWLRVTGTKCEGWAGISAYHLSVHQNQVSPVSRYIPPNPMVYHAPQNIFMFMITKGSLGYLSSMYFSTCGWVCLQSLIFPWLVFVFLLGPSCPIRFLPGPWNIPSRSLIPAVLRSLFPTLGSNDYFITSFVYFSCFLCVVVPAALLHTFPSSFSWPCWLHNFFAILYFLSYCFIVCSTSLFFSSVFDSISFSPLNYTQYIIVCKVHPNDFATRHA